MIVEDHVCAPPARYSFRVRSDSYEPGADVYRCPECGQVFASRDHLQREHH
ncbi:MAG: hypothetical protein ACK5JT_02005 [Hyphomicrobiaceae bacterium]